jgi:hypothetical protein
MSNILNFIFNPFAGAAGFNLFAFGVWVAIIGLIIYAIVEKVFEKTAYAQMTEGQRAIANIKQSREWRC